VIAGNGAGRIRVCVLGASGMIGRTTVAALVRRGHDVVCFVLAVRRCSLAPRCALRI
jgi:nucleoside-diphosphate-sugar epimerase